MWQFLLTIIVSSLATSLRIGIRMNSLKSLQNMHVSNSSTYMRSSDHSRGRKNVNISIGMFAICLNVFCSSSNKLPGFLMQLKEITHELNINWKFFHCSGISFDTLSSIDLDLASQQPSPWQYGWWRMIVDTWWWMRFTYFAIWIINIFPAKVIFLIPIHPAFKEPSTAHKKYACIFLFLLCGKLCWIHVWFRALFLL